MIIIGHRGARGLAPENTLAGFDAALRHRVAYVEFDVRLTKDKQLVVIHDKHTKRIAHIKRPIKDLTLEEIKKMATKSGAEIPTLDEVLDHLGQRVKINIEIKSHGAAKYVIRSIWRLIEQGYAYEDLLVSSFFTKELRAVHYFDENVRLALLHRRLPFGFLMAPRSLHLYGAGFKHVITWPWVIKSAKQHGLFTYSYTINNPRAAALLQDWGIDGICTDRPDYFVSEEWHDDAHITSQPPLPPAGEKIKP